MNRFYVARKTKSKAVFQFNGILFDSWILDSQSRIKRIGGKRGGVASFMVIFKISGKMSIACILRTGRIEIKIRFLFNSSSFFFLSNLLIVYSIYGIYVSLFQTKMVEKIYCDRMKWKRKENNCSLLAQLTRKFKP